MHWFYVEKSQISGDSISITGPDVNHIKNVLRMEPGDRLILCDGDGRDYSCRLERVTGQMVTARIEEWNSSEGELPSHIYLFQGIPKGDKMDLIIQKAVELGVYAVIPVAMKRCVARITGAQKEEKKLMRWREIARAAAKQSGRGIIPEIYGVMSVKEAADLAESVSSYKLLPYEQIRGMERSHAAIREACGHDAISVFIGPEGGFDDAEAAFLIEAGASPISLGRRILRTETAGLAVLSILMFALEEKR